MSSNLLSDMMAQVWAMEPAHLKAFLGDIEAAQGLLVAECMVPTEETQGAKPALNVRDGVAHIAIDGPMLKRVPQILKALGVRATGSVDVGDDIDRALADESVRSIMLDIDSPGGIVSGISELADKIHAADAVKPVLAHSTDMMASAAYWVGSQARSVSATPSSMIGSIGVYNVIQDSSAAAAQRGIKVNVVSSSPLKGAGVPGSSVTDDQIADAQRLVDGYAGMFREAVARGRGKDMSAQATGQVWLAPESMRLGLIDSVSSEHEAHTRAVQNAKAVVAEAPTSPQPGAQESKMAEKNEAGAGTPVANLITPEELAALKSQASEAQATIAKMQADARKSLLDKYADRVAPAMSAEAEKFGEFCGANLEKFEGFLKSLPVVTRADRQSTDATSTDTDKPAITQHDRDVADAFGINAEEAGYMAQFKTFCADGSVVKHDGTKITRARFDSDRAAWLKRFGAVAALALAILLPMQAHAALSAARATVCKGSGRTTSYLMTDSTTIYKGGLVMVVAAGTAEPAAAAASNTGVAGVAEETKTSGTADMWINVIDRVTCKFVASSIAQTGVGNVMYASDDLTFDETQGANQPVAGILVNYVSATSGWIYIDSAVNMGRTNVVSDPLSLTGDLTAGGGAGAVTFTDSASSIVLPDHDTTALLVGSTGALDLITIDTGNDAETVVLTGFAGQTALDVAVGTVNVAEDLVIAGGASALTLSDSASSVVLNDNDTTALLVGASGTLNVLTVDTANAAEGLLVTGYATVTGTTTVAALAGTGATGLGVLIGNGANTACNTTCGGGTCFIGFDAGATAFVACDTATADTCVCLP